MIFCFPKAGKLLPALILILCVLCPLHPQEDTAQEEGIAALEEDLFDDDIFLIEGEGLTVTASPETTQQMKTVTKEEIDAVHAPDLASLLQETLGLGITSYGGYGSQTDINMRGFDSERIAFLIDGVPANSPLSGEFDISMIDLNNIERIEVIYGGSDTKYNVSGALGGVINIITVKKQKPGLHLGGSIANTSAMPGVYRKWDDDNSKGSPHWEDLVDTQNYSLFAGFGAEKFSLSANLFANHAGNHFLYRDTIFEKTRHRESSEVWDTGASVSFVRNLPDDYSKLIISTDFYYGDKNIPTSGYSSLAGKQNDTSSRQNIMLDMPRIFRDDLAAEASLSYSWQRMDYEPPAGNSSLHDQHSITAINRWTWYPLLQLTFRSGWDYRFNYLDSTENGLRSRHDGGVYLTAEYKPHKTFLIIPSVKAVFSGPGSAEPVTPVPKLGFLWNVNDSLSLKNNYFRSFKHPDFEDLYWAGGGGTGNPDLRSEDGWGGDISASYRFKKNWNIEGVFFTQWTNDSIHWYGAGGVWKPQNVGEAIFFGIDTKAGGDIPLPKGPFKKIGLSLSYQYLLSYLLSYGYTFDSDKRIPYMPMHSIGASLGLYWGTNNQGNEGSLLISGHYESLRYAETANITELDPHFLLNLTVNQHINKNISVFAVARNILNTSYESFNDYPMPGLTITIGMRVNYEGIGVP